jgi:hypothetical protein
MMSIDVVITWVKSGDAGWLKEKELSKKLNKNKNKIIEDSKSRYPPTTSSTNDYETELYYTMLSCVLYLPFIRNIVLVTARPQVPAFISDFGSLVKVTHHDEFMPPSRLPTFNSRAIEAHFGYITELSETFIYLNDDMMYGKVIPVTYYFSEDGKPIVRTTRAWDGTPCPYTENKNKIKNNNKNNNKESAYIASNRYVNRLLNGAYVHAERGLLLHHGAPLLKSMFLLAEARFREEWLFVQDSRFRSSDTITPIPLVSYVGIYENGALLNMGRGIRGQGRAGEREGGREREREGKGEQILEWHSAKDTSRTLFDRLCATPPALLCINDIGDQLPKSKIRECFDFYKKFYKKRVEERLT